MEELHIWATDFDQTLSQIPEEERSQTVAGSEYVPSTPTDSSAAEEENERVTRSRAGCKPSDKSYKSEGSDASDSDSPPAAPDRKRNFSQIASSPPRSANMTTEPTPTERYRARQRMIGSFCTQKCMIGLQRDGLLDDDCPNVADHRKASGTDKHGISADEMVKLVNEQLNHNVDNHCDLFARSGQSGQPFEIRCISHGYVIVGKGTVPWLWPKVAREAEFYQALQSVQGSAVPVFLETIDLKMSYWLAATGPVEHMLLIAWGGEPLSEEQEKTPDMSKAVREATDKIRNCGVIHNDIRPDNLLWNAELKCVCSSLIFNTQSYSVSRSTC